MTENKKVDNRKRYLERKKPVIQQPRKHSPPPKDNMNNFLVLMVMSFFAASFYLLSSFFTLDISLTNLVQLYCFFIGISFLIPIKIYRKKLTMSFYEYLIFNFISFAPILISICFLLNGSIKGDAYVETYTIINSEHDEFKTVYFLENNKYEDKEYLRSIKQGDELEVMGSSKLSIYFTEGLFGFRIIEKKTLH